MPIVDPERRAIAQAASDWSSRPVSVIALDIECPVAAPATLRLLSMERWTTHFLIHWFFTTPEPADEIDLRLQRGLRWTATDDLGRTHAGADFNGGGNSPHWRRESWFTPPLDAGATSLSLRCESPVDDSTIQIDLQLGG